MTFLPPPAQVSVLSMEARGCGGKSPAYKKIKNDCQLKCHSYHFFSLGHILAFESRHFLLDLSTWGSSLGIPLQLQGIHLYVHVEKCSLHNRRIFVLVCHANAHGLQTKGLDRVYKRKVGLERDVVFLPRTLVRLEKKIKEKNLTVLQSRKNAGWSKVSSQADCIRASFSRQV